MIRILALLIACLLPVSVLADAGAPMTYSRTNIIIMRGGENAGAPPPLPWQKDTLPTDSPGIIFDVEIRDGMTLYNQKGWYNLSDPSEKSGVMLMFSEPGIAPIIPSTQYVPLDVLMVDKEGVITQIIPNLMMSELQEDILPQQPVLAFLFLKGGICEATGVNPGDRVLYKSFRRPPTVLSAPVQKSLKPAVAMQAAPQPAATPFTAQPEAAPEQTSHQSSLDEIISQSETAPATMQHSPAMPPAGRASQLMIPVP